LEGQATNQDSQEPSSRPDAGSTLRQIAFYLESGSAPSYRVRAFRRAAEAVDSVSPDALVELALRGRLRELPGIGEVTESIVREVLADGRSQYLEKLQEEGPAPQAPEVQRLLDALKGDLHTHSNWSDGGNPIEEMAETTISLGRQYMALTDHSPRLTIAGGLSAERLEQQLEVVARLNETIAPFRILTGIEVDILEDGSLDQTDDLLSRLDVVVASAHSKLRMEPRGMTRRLVTALANPHLDILGHCTGRIIVGRGRPESTFDARAVFEACLRYDKAIEINSRPERLDPPPRLLVQAVDMGCRFAIDSDAHAPGQLSWLRFGCELASAASLEPVRIVNTLDAETLLAWTASHEQ
jgi:putative hydrolase